MQGWFPSPPPNSLHSAPGSTAPSLCRNPITQAQGEPGFPQWFLSEWAGLVFVPLTGATRAPCCLHCVSGSVSGMLLAHRAALTGSWSRFHTFPAVLAHPLSSQVSPGKAWLGRGPWGDREKPQLCVTQLDPKWGLMKPQILAESGFQKKPYSRYILPKVQASGGGKCPFLPEQPALPVPTNLSMEWEPQGHRPSQAAQHLFHHIYSVSGVTDPDCTTNSTGGYTSWFARRGKTSCRHGWMHRGEGTNSNLDWFCLLAFS